MQSISLLHFLQLIMQGLHNGGSVLESKYFPVGHCKAWEFEI